MKRWLPLVAVSMAAALPAGAPPPVSPFPAVLAPADGGSAPPNARLWAFGEGAPAPDEAGFVAQAGGQPLEGALASIGAGLVFTPAADLEAGTAVSLVVTSPGGELTSSFTIAGPRDETPPTLVEPVLLDDPRGTLVIGVEGSDEVGLAGFLALEGEVAVSAAPPDFVLQAAADDEGCATVVAVDLAGNRSAPARVCSEVAPDGGPGEPGGSCPGCGGDASFALLLGVLALRRRKS